jgi:hypothetical protein
MTLSLMRHLEGNLACLDAACQAMARESCVSPPARRSEVRDAVGLFDVWAKVEGGSGG